MTVAEVEANEAQRVTKESLTIERANSIGWFFIESYYALYNKLPETLYKLYTATASISHGDIPTTSKTLKQATGVESIKLLFKDLQEKEVKNKIIVINADIQLINDNSILIVVNGEWSKAGSQYYQFNQTFILYGTTETVFDISNDILRFIDYDFKHESIVEKPKEQAIEEAKEEVKEPVKEKETIQEPVKEKEPVEAVEEKKPVEEKKEEPKEEKKEEEEQQPSEEDQRKSNGPISWAALAATAKEKADASPVSATATATPTPKPAPKKVPAQVPVALPNGKYKKEDWFPIYIRGCEKLSEKALKDHLTQQFGVIKFFKQSANIALCDFLHADGQKKALAAKATVVDGTTISLEIRESKGARKDPKKDKVDAKRKNDKKQLPKKK